MEIKHDKYKVELSKYYKLGYRMGFKAACSSLQKMEAKDIPIEDERFKVFIAECIENLIEANNSYPCIDPILPDEVLNENS